MKLTLPRASVSWLVGLLVIGTVVTGAVTVRRWFPPARRWVSDTIAVFRSASTAESDDSESTSESATSLLLSEAARKNLGLTAESIQPITLTEYRRSITIPAVVVERPARSRIQVATPMTGVVTRVHAVPGESVAPGTLLFEIRLTHEDLVRAQTEFLQTLGELDVEEREMARLEDPTKSGAVARRVLLEHEYQRDRLQALLDAQRESLRLHGLSEEQVERIRVDRRLLRELRVFAPTRADTGPEELRLSGEQVQQVSYRPLGQDVDPEAPLVLGDLHVHKGQAVTAGETLGVLLDYRELFIEGLAFEQDAAQLLQTEENEWTVSAVFGQPGHERSEVADLRIVRLASEIDAESRTLKVYVGLPNQVSHRRADAEERQYVSWRYRPGQRLQLRVPVEVWADQIVLPPEAVTREGAEFYVFQENGTHFDRIPVHVRHRDQHAVVIAADGALFPGDVVALRGAHQMQMALKNKGGGAVVAHHGHTH